MFQWLSLRLLVPVASILGLGGYSWYFGTPSFLNKLKFWGPPKGTFEAVPKVTKASHLPKDGMVMVYEDWCGHCKHMKPGYGKLAGDLGSGLYRLRASDNPELANQKLGVGGYPTLKFMHDGKIGDYKGGRDPQSIKDALTSRAECLAGKASGSTCQKFDGGFPTFDDDGLPSLSGGTIELASPLDAKFLAYKDRLPFAAMKAASDPNFFNSAAGKSILAENQKVAQGGSAADKAALRSFEAQRAAGFDRMKYKLDARTSRIAAEKYAQNLQFFKSIDRSKLDSPEGKKFLSSEMGQKYQAWLKQPFYKSAWQYVSGLSVFTWMGKYWRKFTPWRWICNSTPGRYIANSRVGMYVSETRVYKFLEKNAFYVKLVAGVTFVTGCVWYIKRRFFSAKPEEPQTDVPEPPCAGCVDHDHDTDITEDEDQDNEQYLMLIFGLVLIVLGGFCAACYAKVSMDAHDDELRRKVMAPKWDEENPKPISNRTSVDEAPVRTSGDAPVPVVVEDAPEKEHRTPVSHRTPPGDPGHPLSRWKKIKESKSNPMMSRRPQKPFR